MTLIASESLRRWVKRFGYHGPRYEGPREAHSPDDPFIRELTTPARAPPAKPKSRDFRSILASVKFQGIITPARFPMSLASLPPGRDLAAEMAAQVMWRISPWPAER